MGRTWDDNQRLANGPRERARAETLSEGLGGGVSQQFAGPGRWYPPRDVPMARHLSADKFPFSADIDRELRGEEPPVRRQPPEQHRGDALPSEKNPPARRHGMIRHDGQGGAQQQPARVIGDPQDDMMAQLGAEHWRPGARPDAAPGPLCANESCQKTLTPGPAGSAKRFCSAACRRADWGKKKQAVAT